MFRNSARSYRDLAKTDKIDAKMLSEYEEKMNPRIQERQEDYCFDLDKLTELIFQSIRDLSGVFLERRNKEDGMNSKDFG